MITDAYISICGNLQGTRPEPELMQDYTTPHKVRRAKYKRINKTSVARVHESERLAWAGVPIVSTLGHKLSDADLGGCCWSAALRWHEPLHSVVSRANLPMSAIF